MASDEPERYESEAEDELNPARPAPAGTSDNEQEDGENEEELEEEEEDGDEDDDDDDDEDVQDVGDSSVMNAHPRPSLRPPHFRAPCAV